MEDEGLILVSGSGRSRALATDMYNILKNDYSLDDKVEVLISKRARELSDHELEAKDETRPFLIDRFPDSEVRVECGKRALQKLNSKHVVFVNYFYEPEIGFSVNDKISETRAFGELLQHVQLRKLTLAAPYWPYIQAHSVEKYSKFGFHQANTLKRFMRTIYSLKDSWVNRQPKIEIIVIDPHNDKIKTYCEEFGIEYRYINPFQKDIDFTKLAINPNTSDGAAHLASLQPFYSHFVDNKEKYDNSVLVALDAGTEHRTKKFALALDRSFTDVCALKKIRLDTGERKMSIQPYSTIKESDLAGKRCILIDDMGISFGSADYAAKFLLDNNAEAVELWISHNKCQVSDDKVESLALDKIVYLDTINKDIPKGIKLERSANLLASITYKSYMAEVLKARYS